MKLCLKHKENWELAVNISIFRSAVRESAFSRISLGFGEGGRHWITEAGDARVLDSWSSRWAVSAMA
jgi:hypothetical protein